MVDLIIMEGLKKEARALATAMNLVNSERSVSNATFFAAHLCL